MADRKSAAAKKDEEPDACGQSKSNFSFAELHRTATLPAGGAPPSGADWVHEVKFDGYRMQLRVEDGKARPAHPQGPGLDAQSSPPSPKRRAKLPDCILDGEIVALDHNGAPDFAALQAALSDGKTEGLVFFAFDLLFADGEDLRALPLSERKARLEKLLKGAGPAVCAMSSISPAAATRC